jgi:hypothetical protein
MWPLADPLAKRFVGAILRVGSTAGIGLDADPVAENY